MITTLKKHGNAKALVIPKAILDLLNITDKTKFNIETDGVRLSVHSIDQKVDQKFKDSWQEVSKDFSSTFKSLATK